MDDDTKIAIITIFLCGLLIIGALLFGWWWSSYQCDSKWSSFPNRWGIVKGCQIEVGGKWIPSESYYFKQE